MQTKNNVTIENWKGNILSHPAKFCTVESVDEIVQILKDTDTYPSPVRAVSSNHSTTECAVADGGTMIDMRGFNRILEIGDGFVRVEAGALYIDVAKALEEKDYQFYVNVELGNLSMGSAASGSTKDASFEGEYGQVCSYLMGVKMVCPSGEIVEIDESDPELLSAVRSSFGLMGVILEVTFKTKKLQALKVRHEIYTLEKFKAEFSKIVARKESIMMYFFPFLDTILIEFREYIERKDIDKNSRVWRIRNYLWSTLIPTFGSLASAYIPWKPFRYGLLNMIDRISLRILQRILTQDNTSPTSQQIRYLPGDQAHWSKYVFSIWAFPKAQYVNALSDYFQFCKDYYREQGYRCNILNVGYRINHDTNPLLSYSYEGEVLTFDPVSTGDAGWEEFLTAYNQFCSQHNGQPLMNQTPRLTREQVSKAFGSRLDTLREYCVKYDPRGRMVNAYFEKTFNLKGEK